MARKMLMLFQATLMLSFRREIKTYLGTVENSTRTKDVKIK